MDPLKRQFSQLQQTLKDQAAEAKALKKTIKDMKKEYEEKFTVNYDVVTSLQERVQELEDYNQREDSAAPAQAAVPSASRSSGSVDIGICQMSARRHCVTFFSYRQGSGCLLGQDWRGDPLQLLPVHIWCLG